MKHGLSYRSWQNKPKDKNMDVILTTDELKEAVELYLKPKMKYHKITQVHIREVKIGPSKKLEVLATLDPKEIKNENG